MTKFVRNEGIWGLMAEFDSVESLVKAASAVRHAGYRAFDAYTPAPVEALTDIVELRRPWVPRIVLISALCGGSLGFLLQWWISAVDYPLNVGGRPLFSWPAFVPVTFELTILCGALGAVIGMLALNGLPAPYHPVFNVDAFRRVTSDGFFLSIESTDERFNLEQTTRFLEELNPLEVYAVDR